MNRNSFEVLNDFDDMRKCTAHCLFIYTINLLYISDYFFLLVLLTNTSFLFLFFSSSCINTLSISHNSWTNDFKCNMLFQGAWPQNGLDLAVLGLPSLWTWMKSVSFSFRYEWVFVPLQSWPVGVNCNLIIVTYLVNDFIFLRMIIMVQKRWRTSSPWCPTSVSSWTSTRNTTADFHFQSLRRFVS